MATIEHRTARSADYPASYYAATANIARSAQPLAGAQTTDICVVGAGYSGLSAAIHLAEKGYAVAVVEAARVGWGASGRNGGQIVNGLNAGLDSIARRYGAQTEAFVGGLLQEGARIIYRLIEQYAIDCDLKPGNIYAAYTARHMRALRDKQVLWRRHGMADHELLDSAAIRQHVGSQVYCGGMLDRSGAHMQPLNLALGEAHALESLGGRIFEQSPVTNIEKTPDGLIVRTHEASISAKSVLLCGNAYLGRVVPALAIRVMPVSTQLIASEPLDAQHAAALLPTDHCVEDSRYILDYYRLSVDKRMLFGGGVVYGGTDPADIVAKLRPNMHEVFPSLRGVGIDYAWSGNFALSFTRVPQLGRLDNGIYFAHGYSGHGVTGSHLFGSILAAAVDGDLSRFDTFARLPWVPFPGGQLLRAPYSTLGSWWYALRDKIRLLTALATMTACSRFARTQDHG